MSSLGFTDSGGSYWSGLSRRSVRRRAGFNSSMSRSVRSRAARARRTKRGGMKMRARKEIVQNWGRYLPSHLLKQFVLDERLVMSTGAFAYSSTQGFYANSLYNPFGTLFGSQPTLWDTLSPLYKNYHVRGVKMSYTVRAMSSVTPVSIMLHCDGTQLASIANRAAYSWEAMPHHTRSKIYELTPVANTNGTPGSYLLAKPVTITKYFDFAKVVTGYDRTAINFTGNSSGGSNPSAIIYTAVSICGLDQTTDSIIVDGTVSFEFYSELFDPILRTEIEDDHIGDLTTAAP